MTKLIAIRVDEADLDALRRIAEAKRSTVSQVIREAIAQAITKAEEK